MPASVYVSFDAPEGVPATPRSLTSRQASARRAPPSSRRSRTGRFTGRVA